MKGWKALKALCDYKMIRRKEWPEGDYMQITITSDDEGLLSRHFADDPQTEECEVFFEFLSDLIGEDDWEVVE